MSLTHDVLLRSQFCTEASIVLLMIGTLIGGIAQVGEVCTSYPALTSGQPGGHTTVSRPARRCFSLHTARSQVLPCAKAEPKLSPAYARAASGGSGHHVPHTGSQPVW